VGEGARATLSQGFEWKRPRLPLSKGSIGKETTAGGVLRPVLLSSVNKKQVPRLRGMVRKRTLPLRSE